MSDYGVDKIKVYIFVNYHDNGYSDYFVCLKYLDLHFFV